MEKNASPVSPKPVSDGQPRKIRVLHVVQTLGVGGMERRVLRLALYLDPERYEIHAVTLRPTVGNVLPWPEGRHTFYPIESGLHADRLLGLAKFMHEGRFDIVHSHNWATMFYGVLAGWLARVPVVLHGEHGRNLADVQGIPRKRELIGALLARLATGIVAVNAFVADDVHARWKLPRRKIVTIPNGVDVERFSPGLPGNGQGEEFVVGTITRFDSVKNLPCLIRAFERFHLSRPDLKKRLILVGLGPDLEKIRLLAEQSLAADLIDFPGETDKPEECYRRFNVYVNSSFSEGMSNSILEAMACGLPLVVSDVPGNRCWLREGENALFFASDDDSALVDRLAALADDDELRAKLSANNWRTVVEEYDNRDFLRRYDTLYRQLLNP